MNLPKNKDGKYYLLDKDGKEKVFNHAIDVQEALFGVFGKDDQGGKFQQEYFLPDDFDMKINPKKNTGATKEEMMDRKLRGRGRPLKVATPPEPAEEEKAEKVEDKKE